MLTITSHVDAPEVMTAIFGGTRWVAVMRSWRAISVAHTAPSEFAPAEPFRR